MAEGGCLSYWNSQIVKIVDEEIFYKEIHRFFRFKCVTKRGENCVLRLTNLNHFLCLWFILSWNFCVYEFLCLWIFVSMNFCVYDLLCLWFVVSMICSVYDLLCLWFVVSMICCVYELLILWTILFMNCCVYEFCVYELLSL